MQKYYDIMSFTLTQKEGGDLMSSSDLIWNLVMMLIEKIEDSKKDENSNDKDE